VQDKSSNQKTRVLLNYYPCSYGDTLASMFGGIAPDWRGKLTQSSWGDFKFPTFYSMTLEEKVECWQKFSFNPVTCCHRQQGFDFNEIEPVQVISIRVNDRSWLHRRVIKLHWNSFELNDTKLDKIRSQMPAEEHHKVVEFEYVKWAKENILSSDLVLDFELIHSDELAGWCQDHGVSYDQSVIDLIKQDLKDYQ